MPSDLKGLSLQECQGVLRAKFTDCGIETADLDARFLLQAVTGFDHAGIILNGRQTLKEAEILALEEMVYRRLAREPVSRILGEREFYGRNFFITSDVLDPRADSETLVEQALSVARGDKPVDEFYQILDIGTGSGAIIVSLLCEITDARGLATDASESALKIARQNACRHNVDDRLELQLSNWCQGVDRKFDMIVSNPPYIVSSDISKLARDVKDFDPALALDGGFDGLRAYREIAEYSPLCLKKGGSILLETGFDQAESVIKIFTSAGFIQSGTPAAIKKDLGGNDRVVTMLWDN